MPALSLPRVLRREVLAVKSPFELPPLPCLPCRYSAKPVFLRLFCAMRSAFFFPALQAVRHWRHAALR